MSEGATPRRRKAPEIIEQEFVKEILSEATGVHFEVVAPHPGFPLPVESLEWFMRCRNKDEIAKAPYLNTVWKESGGEIWLESLAIGDTIDWIEIAYGEDSASASIDTDYSRFEDPSFQQEFGRKFPIVLGRIREYEEAVARVSKETEASLEIRRAGAKGMLVFTIAARVAVPKRGALAPLGSALKKSASALNVAYDEIEKLGRR